MFRALSIQGFRMFEDFTLSGLVPFNIFVGPNNSGKTSLLEAIFLHCAPVNFHVLLSLITLRYGGFHSNPPYIFDQIRWLFTNPGYQPIPELGISGKWEQTGEITERVTRVTLYSELSKESDFRRQISNSSRNFVTSSDELVITPPALNSKGLVIGSVALEFQTSHQELIRGELEFTTEGPLRIGSPRIKTDINTVFSGAGTYKSPDAGIDAYNESVKRAHDKTCIDLLQQIDPDVEDADILLAADKSPQLYIKHKRLGFTPIGNLGDGARRMFHLATLFAQCHDGVILIDELESAIHTAALERFIDWIIEIAHVFNVQVFATTHSLECLDAMLGSQKLEKDDFRLFRLKQQANQVTCKMIEWEMLERLRFELGQEIR